VRDGNAVESDTRKQQGVADNIGLAREMVAIPGFGSSKFKKAAKLKNSLLFLSLEPQGL
jgi:hypothetical protein